MCASGIVVCVMHMAFHRVSGWNATDILDIEKDARFIMNHIDKEIMNILEQLVR